MWRRSIAVVALFGLISSSTAFAQWVPNGAQVVPRILDFASPFGLVADGESGAIVLAAELSPTPHLLFRKTRDGLSPPGWPSTALAPAFIWDFGPATDGAGGAYVGKVRQGPSFDDIIIHHIGGDGDFAPGWPPGGVNVGKGTGIVFGGIVDDLAGGVYVVWTTLNVDTYEMHSQRLDPLGAVSSGWPTGGIVIVASAEPLLIASVQSSGQGLYVQGHHSTLQTLPNPESSFMARLAPDGQLPAGWSPAAKPIPFADYLFDGEFAPDAQGGYFTSASNGFLRRLVHVLADGTPDPAWPDSGLAIDPDLTRRQLAYNPVPDGMGGCFARFDHDSAGNGAGFSPRVVHITASGTMAPGWPALGGRLPREADGRVGKLIVPDGSGGVFDVWLGDYLQNQNDFATLNAHHLGSDGLTYPGWPETGIKLASATGSRRNVHAVSDTHRGLIAAWEDSRSAPGEWGIYAIGVTATGSITADVPVRNMSTALAMRAVPTPSSGPVRLTLRMPQEGRARVEILDVTGRKVRDVFEGTLLAGEHPFDWDGRGDSGGPIPPGVYLARTSAFGATKSTRIVRLGAVR